MPGRIKNVWKSRFFIKIFAADFMLVLGVGLMLRQFARPHFFAGAENMADIHGRPDALQTHVYQSKPDR